MDRFRCPLCAAVLVRDGRTLRCADNHAFDLAREGYVNLLPSHHRRSDRAGDSAEMVAARAAFLGAGHYAPLAEAVARRVPPMADVLDLGCGEGAFTAALRGASVYGVDISRPAIRMAAKRCPGASFAVANATRLPFPDASFDVLCVIMAPIFAEAARVLRSDGLLLRVSPGPDHLSALRALVFADPRAHTPATLELEGFEHVGSERVTFAMELDARARTDLLAMTPMQHRARPDDLARATADAAVMEITADFVIDRFRRGRDTEASD